MRFNMFGCILLLYLIPVGTAGAQTATPAAAITPATPTATPAVSYEELVRADFNEDGYIGPEDLLRFQQAWNFGFVPPTATATPTVTSTPTPTSTFTPYIEGLWSGNFTDTFREVNSTQSGEMTWSLQQDGDRFTGTGYDSQGHEFTTIKGRIEPGLVIDLNASYVERPNGETSLSYTGILSGGTLDGAYTGRQDHDTFRGTFSLSPGAE